jgi:hypothetical protein
MSASARSRAQGAGPGAGKREGAFQNWKLVNADPLIKLSCSAVPAIDGRGGQVLA